MNQLQMIAAITSAITGNNANLLLILQAQIITELPNLTPTQLQTIMTILGLPLS